MSKDAALFITLFVCLGFVVSGFAVLVFVFKPEWSDKILGFTKTPLSPWTMKPEADPVLKAATYFVFFILSGLLCFLIYWWTRYFVIE